MRATHRKLLMDLLSLPTSPLNEQFVAGYVRQWAARRPDVRVEADAFGNLLLRLRRGRQRASRPIVLSAHMDHPGFEAGRMMGRNRLRAIWRGTVGPAYFRGTRVQFFSDGRWMRGTIRAVKTAIEDGRRRVQSVVVGLRRPVAPGAVGMWDLPDPVVRGSRIHARGCDDVAGVAAILVALDELCRGRNPVDVRALFTRAEEVGFAGALAVCRSGLLPRRARLVCIETSSEIAGVRMGNGPVLRVGDRRSVFTPGVTAWCRDVADELGKRDRQFRYQRKLMDGGTCESTVFCANGYQATGLCVVLGNYHNMDVKRRRIAAEYIDLNDFASLVRWLAALATRNEPRQPDDSPLRKFLKRLDRRWSGPLRRTAARI